VNSGSICRKDWTVWTPNLKTAVVLRDVQGLTNEEEALILEISISSLKARLNRGRVVLREYPSRLLEQGYLSQRQ
jgi:DNA-directed RNA polymerase specialized sigma24 family protein